MSLLDNIYNNKEINELYENFTFTPMMQEWKNFKEETTSKYWKNTILFYQLWTFYETYFHDAAITSKILWFTLTKKNKNKPDSALMAWMPLSANFNKLEKLIEHNFNIVIVNEYPCSENKSGIKRAISKIITPSTNLEFLSEKNNYLLSIKEWNSNIWLTLLDISTWDMKFIETEKNNYEKIWILNNYNISEVISDKKLSTNIENILKNKIYNIVKYDFKNYIWKLEFQFWNFLEETDLYMKEDAIVATFNALEYAKEIINSDLDYINDIEDITDSNTLKMDTNTIKNLEIVNTFNGGRKNTLYWIINNTSTPFWSRLLRHNILNPFVNKYEIEKRLNSISYMINDSYNTQRIREKLSFFFDIEKLSAKLWNNTITPWDILNIKDSLIHIHEIKNLISNDIKERNINFLWKKLHTYDTFIKNVDNAIIENPCNNIREWNIFKDWYNSELDKERNIFFNIENILKKEEENLREYTWIDTLKIINNNLWFFIEIKNQDNNKIPNDFSFIKTLSNKTRYINENISELNKKYKLSEINIKNIEYQLFQELRIELSNSIPDIMSDVKTLSELDILMCFTYNSIEFNYNKPKISDSFNIIDWRHPIIEYLNINKTFSSNNFNSDVSIKLLTWPNMWWKSTYLKQTALINILAQIWSYIPASQWSEVKLVDSIFTRIWANDNIENWLSTFAVEMKEMWYICNNYTNNSLVLLDEVWRWTDTKNWLALSKSFLDFFVKNKKWVILFSTHYSELVEKYFKDNSFIELLKTDINFDEEWNIIFEHKISKGSISDSYGIEIAKRYNIPDEIIFDANKIKNNL